MGLFFFFYQKLESQMLLFGGKLWQFIFMCSCCFEIFTPYFLPQYTDQVQICSFLGGFQSYELCLCLLYPEVGTSIFYLLICPFQCKKEYGSYIYDTLFFSHFLLYNMILFTLYISYSVIYNKLDAFCSKNRI